MAKNLNSIDSVRASREGHEFHEAWTARKALQLLLPTDNLVGIAVEGLHPTDQAAAAPKTVQIADIVLYYGKRSTFKDADSVKIVQFKYSVSSRDDDFRASHAKKTVTKFAAAYLDYKKRYGAKEVRDKLEFELITNRPIYSAFEQAIASIANGKFLSGEVKKQAEQFKAASGLDDRTLVEFAGKCRFTGLVGSLTDTKRDLSRTLVDWSATSDAVAGARLGAMRQMVRDKAGCAGTNRNVIERVDVFAALDVPDTGELFPCPASFPEVGAIVERKQLAEAITLIPGLDKPLLIHAAGGVGKTVFLESLAKAIFGKHEVLLFDCFGGGAYRALDDSRHLPKRGLVHIANILACRGLCDPLMPGNDNMESLRVFRRRLSQCVKTLSTASAERKLILFIDAIDNAAQHADDRNEDSFPTLLLESFHHNGSVPGVMLVVSCRSHRIDMSTKGVPCHDFKLEPFSLSETETYLRDRLSNLTQAEIQVAQARSGGNGRILEHLVKSNRGLLDQFEIKNVIKLDDLLKGRIEAALSEVEARGYKKTETNAFLAGLSVLPPPVPINEYAEACGMDISAIESFAADLAPLLERTKYGLMFRDEPTETLIRKNFGSDDNALRRVARNLLSRQGRSVYAARALPGLLQKLDDGKRLFELAFDERFPGAITSTVGKRNIRYARLKAAVLHAANKQDHNRLVHLLIELSTIAAVDQRGTDYILDYPDLVITARDVDATRRLFETRTNWPGTRHARLAIANTLSGDLDDAYRHAVSAYEWISHYRRQDRDHSIDRAGPEQLDIAAIPFCLITQNHAENAIGFMREWKDWYAYEIGEHLFGLLKQAEPAASQTGSIISKFLNGMTDDIGIIVSALSFLELDDIQRNQLIKKLSKACNKEKELETNDNFHQEANYHLQDGLLKASAIAVSMGFSAEALTISSRAPHERSGVWGFSDHFSDRHVLPFLAHVALNAAVKGEELREQDILPKELYEICSGVTSVSSSDFRKKLKERLESCVRSKQDQSKEDNKSISPELKRNAESFIDGRLEPLLILANAFVGLLRAPVNKGDKAFLALLETWAETRKKRDQYSTEKFDRFFQLLGCRLAVLALWVRSDLRAASVKIFLERLHEQEILNVSTLIEVVATLAKRSPLHSFAGEQALKTRSLIENEYDVGVRATLYAQLARAILPASSDEAAIYFRAGLEQMDAIGSGDYQFTNELLLFASTLRGDELTEQDFHTLTNICELNMSYDEEKFPWFAFAKGLSRTSGCKTLAKLARWDDRSKISLNYTLLPYLTALIDDGKIEPEDAIALNRLSDPAELYSCDTAIFAKAIDEKNYPNQAMLVSELIRQFEDNNPGIPMGDTMETLASIGKRVLGKASETTAYFSIAREHFAKVRNELNDHLNYHGKSDPQLLKKTVSTDRQNRIKIRKLAVRTKPNDEVSMEKAIDELNGIQHIYDMKGEFFENLRLKVPFSDRPQYIKTISRLANLDVYTKLHELEKCKCEWEKSTAALTSIYESLGVPILLLHTEDFVSFDQLSGSRLKELSDLSGVPIVILALELIKIFVSPDSDTAASVWLGLGSIVCGEADRGEGQSALTRLLKSNSAKLASNVADGKWKDGLYPVNETTKIASGLVWRTLGSPNASDRWRAAHGVRCFAKFERWKVIDDLVARFPTKDAHPFQAPELPFYYMHARLWLLIALARIAIDYPKNIARYHKVLIKIVLDEESPHVLMRHFAAQAILACVNSGNLKLSARITKQIRDIDFSPFPRLRKKLKEGGNDSFYQGRPKNVPEPKTEFYFDYDFDKYDVHSLSDVFGKPGWEIKDRISEVVYDLDPAVKSMYETGGRETSRRNSLGEMTPKYHSYGQQLGWHALFLVAGRLLRQHPVTDDWYYDDDPWAEWLNRSLLTRNDGLWLSDGMDRPPLDVKVNLLEKGEDGLVITGSKTKILSLVGIGSALVQKIVVEGSWKSPDNIRVDIRSVLVAHKKAKACARQLIQEEPFFVWLPTFEEYEYEHLRSNKKDYLPWIAYSSMESGLDKEDTLGTVCAVRRPRFAENIIVDFSLVMADPFGRIWKNSDSKSVAHSDAWRYENEHEDESDVGGTRLVCSGGFLSDVLAKRNADLLVLVKLQRYEKGITGSSNGNFSHTVAVFRVNETLDFEFYKGAVNKLHQAKY